jgi:glycine dehydrogenase subunit 1
MSFGGPSLGFMCATKALIRKMPGRIVGATTDAKGQRVFVLTLQAREQHIRREKATSNICSNQGLMTLYVSIYLSVMGPKGLKEVNELGCSGAHYLAEKLCATGKMSLLYPEKPYLNEFAVKCNVDVDKLQAKCAEEGILAGVKIDNDTLLLAVTEMQSEEEINRFISIVEKF